MPPPSSSADLPRRYAVASPSQVHQDASPTLAARQDIESRDDQLTLTLVLTITVTQPIPSESTLLSVPALPAMMLSESDPARTGQPTSSPSPPVDDAPTTITVVTPIEAKPFHPDARSMLLGAGSVVLALVIFSALFYYTRRCLRQKAGLYLQSEKPSHRRSVLSDSSSVTPYEYTCPAPDMSSRRKTTTSSLHSSGSAVAVDLHRSLSFTSFGSIRSNSTSPLGTTTRPPSYHSDAERPIRNVTLPKRTFTRAHCGRRIASWHVDCPGNVAPSESV
ncbi:hypothetical protein C8Q77DRAFT_1151093 [Trametes polyzona]|nr:hypothetical protein C8Q77DRAFT_1151093 [Trametes polyzona]